MKKIIVKVTFDIRDLTRISNRYDAYICKVSDMAHNSVFFDDAAQAFPLKRIRDIEEGQTRFKFITCHFGGGHIIIKDVKQGVMMTITGPIFGKDEIQVSACYLAARLIAQGVKRVNLDVVGGNAYCKEIIEKVFAEKHRVIRTQNTISGSEKILIENRVVENRAENGLTCS